MRRLAMWTLAYLSLGIATPPATGATDPFRITAKEKAACTSDAIRLCAFTYPDEAKLLSCMKSNRTSLSAVCLVAFDAGMKRRGLD